MIKPLILSFFIFYPPLFYLNEFIYGTCVPIQIGVIFKTEESILNVWTIYTVTEITMAEIVVLPKRRVSVNV